MNKKGALKSSVVGLITVIFFFLALIIFSMTFINTTNPTNNIFNNNSQYNFNSSISRLNNTITNFSSTSTSVVDELGKSEPSASDYIFLIFRGAFYIPFTLVGFIISGFYSLSLLLKPIFGATGSTIVTLGLSVLFAKLFIDFALDVVKAIRTGESER